MSNTSVREQWADRFGRPEPKVICVGLNYARPAHAGESGMEGAVLAAPLRQVREHAPLQDGDPSRSCSPAWGTSTLEAELTRS